MGGFWFLFSVFLIFDLLVDIIVFFLCGKCKFTMLRFLQLVKISQSSQLTIKPMIFIHLDSKCEFLKNLVSMVA